MRTLFAPVTIYTQPGCTACHRVQEQFEAAGINYDVVDLTRNGQARTYVVDVLNARSVPVIASDVMDPIIGSDPEEIQDLIAALTASETGL